MGQSPQIGNRHAGIIGLFYKSLSLKFHEDSSWIDRVIGS